SAGRWGRIAPERPRDVLRDSPFGLVLEHHGREGQVDFHNDLAGPGCGAPLDREGQTLERKIRCRGVTLDNQIMSLKVSHRLFKGRLHLGKRGGRLKLVRNTDGDFWHGSLPETRYRRVLFDAAIIRPGKLPVLSDRWRQCGIHSGRGPPEGRRDPLDA